MDDTPILTADTFQPFDVTQPPPVPFAPAPLPDPNDVLNTITEGIVDAVPGGKLLVSLLQSVGDLPKFVSDFIHYAETGHPTSWMKALLVHSRKFERVMELTGGNVWQVFTDVGINEVFTQMLHAGLGVDPSKFTKEEKDAVDTVDGMIGFALVLPFIVSSVNAAGAALFGSRWSHSIGELLGEIPEEMGLTWALGVVIDKSFEAAQGAVLEEAINKQKRPSRIAWQQARVLLKQGILDDKQMTEIFEAQGFPDREIKWLKQLSDQTIPVSDIAQLWYRDVINDDKARELIAALGFSEQQTEWIYNIYIAKADNSATATYRSIARQMYTNHLLTEDQYETILKEGNYPAKLIAEDIKAITLEQTIGRVLHSVTAIKTRYQHRAIDAAEATKELQELNYAPTYITELIQTWDLPPLRHTHGLSQSKVLSYMMSGLISKTDALPMLLATGLNSDDAKFLIAHPTSNTGAKQHARTPGLIFQAYTDGAIPQDKLEDAFRSAGVADNDLAYYVNIAKYRLSHRKGSATYTEHATAADYRAAFKVGIIDFQQCVAALQYVGYSSDDAMLLTEITNKGPLQPPQPPVFATPDDAKAYMIARGYQIVPPPDPRLMAAEGMLAMLGYSWVAPYTPSPPPIVAPPGDTLSSGDGTLPSLP